MSKKAEPVAEIPLLGRPSSHLKMGIVGMPNVGKSTLFNLLTKMNIPAENFPFCTIDPNVSRVEVPDERFEFLCSAHNPASRVAAHLSVTDIAGLVKGAHEGEGLGNAFLSHIRAVDGIFHVTRVFEDSEVLHVEGGVDPIRDMDIIARELRLKDIETLNTQIHQLEKVALRVDKTKKFDLDVCKKMLDMLQKEEKDIRFGTWSGKEVDVINPLQLLTAKPVVYLVNTSEANYIKKRDKWLGKVKTWIDAHGGGAIIPFSAAFESKLADITDAEERKAFLTESGVPSAIPKIVTTGYHALQLIHYFTAGSDEVKCWTIRRGTGAQDAAGLIHTDLRDGFICAEVMAFDDFKAHGSETAAKSAGLVKQQGKKYIVQDGDIIYFRCNTGSGLSKKKK